MANLLIEYGADVHQKNMNTGDTVLFYVHNNHELFTYFVNKKVDVNITNKQNQTAIQLFLSYSRNKQPVDQKSFTAKSAPESQQQNSPEPPPAYGQIDTNQDTFHLTPSTTAPPRPTSKSWDEVSLEKPTGSNDFIFAKKKN